MPLLFLPIPSSSGECYLHVIHSEVRPRRLESSIPSPGDRVGVFLRVGLRRKGSFCLQDLKGGVEGGAAVPRRSVCRSPSLPLSRKAARR